MKKILLLLVCAFSIIACTTEGEELSTINLELEELLAGDGDKILQEEFDVWDSTGKLPQYNNLSGKAVIETVDNVWARVPDYYSSLVPHRETYEADLYLSLRYWTFRSYWAFDQAQYLLPYASGEILEDRHTTSDFDAVRVERLEAAEWALALSRAYLQEAIEQQHEAADVNTEAPVFTEDFRWEMTGRGSNGFERWDIYTNTADDRWVYFTYHSGNVRNSRAELYFEGEEIYNVRISAFRYPPNDVRLQAELFNHLWMIQHEIRRTDWGTGPFYAYQGGVACGSSTRCEYIVSLYSNVSYPNWQINYFVQPYVYENFRFDLLRDGEIVLSYAAQDNDKFSEVFAYLNEYIKINN